MKKWGKSEYWGLSSEHDPDWLLTERQKKLRDDLIELCRVKIRPHAIHCDKTYTFPRESLDVMADLGLLGLIVPQELGGLGESHTCCAMVVETLARYGCPSTAMVYNMHIVAVCILLFRYHNNPLIKDLLSRLDKDKLIGSLSYSDPATGGHFWFPLSSKVKQLDDEKFKLLKFGSWVTSAGHADWYAIQTVTPSRSPGDFSDLSCFLILKDEVRANTDDWSALGMRGNMSGPMVAEGVFTKERMVGAPGDGKLSNGELTPCFLLFSSSCFNGISLGSMDLARKHVTRKAHADVGMRICDYPTIQDYFGEALCEVNSSRALAMMMAQAMDLRTNNNTDWPLFTDRTRAPRSGLLHWMWQLKWKSAKVADDVTTRMLHATGGSGYKNDLGIERLLRDGKAGWVMAPSNEVLRQFVGKMVLLGAESLDVWEQTCNRRVLHHEVEKLSVEQKKELARSLLEEVEREENGPASRHPFQETDFENPFNTCPPAVNDKVIRSSDGVTHAPALKPDTWTSLQLQSYRDINDKMGAFVFALPRPTDHTGLLAGQYVMVRVVINGKEHTRYFSPVSRPTDFGLIELVLRFENQGIMSQHFKALKPGDRVEFQGPCGGFEYEAGCLEELSLLASGGGITPGLQLVREVLSNPSDTTRITLLYFSQTYHEILYREELDKYQASDSRLKVIYTLGEAPENWEGEEGFIDTQMIDKHITKPSGRKNKIVMCGGPLMTIACLHSLRSLNFPSHAIFIYGQFGTEQVKMVYGRNVTLASHTSQVQL